MEDRMLNDACDLRRPALAAVVPLRRARSHPLGSSTSSLKCSTTRRLPARPVTVGGVAPLGSFNVHPPVNLFRKNSSIPPFSRYLPSQPNRDAMATCDVTEQCSLLAARAHGGDVQTSLDRESMRLLLDELPMIARTTSYPLTSPSYCGSVDPIHELDRDYGGGYDTDAGAKLLEDDCVSLCLSLADQQLHEPEPVVADELRKSLALMYPIMLTYVLEYIPGLVCIVLVGHMDSPDTKRLVDAATLSTMVRMCPFQSLLSMPLTSHHVHVDSSPTCRRSRSASDCSQRSTRCARRRTAPTGNAKSGSTFSAR